jgi:hypothetical protein
MSSRSDSSDKKSFSGILMNLGRASFPLSEEGGWRRIKVTVSPLALLIR